MISRRSLRFFTLLVAALFFAPMSITTATTIAPQIQAVVCDELNRDLSLASSIEQGQIVRICLRSADEDSFIMSGVQQFLFTQEVKVAGESRRRMASIVKAQSAVSKEGKVDSRFSAVSCDASINLCVVETKLLDKFFNTQEERPTVSISGEVELEDTTRKMRGANKVSTPFSFTIELSHQ